MITFFFTQMTKEDETQIIMQENYLLGRTPQKKFKHDLKHS